LTRLTEVRLVAEKHEVYWWFAVSAASFDLPAGTKLVLVPKVIEA
jgi:hypothetical protein